MIHKGRKVKGICRNTGIKIIYLPLYCPELSIQLIQWETCKMFLIKLLLRRCTKIYTTSMISGVWMAAWLEHAACQLQAV
ncbi:hypothetical protein VP01_5063g1 [Puccinia sorghi]|uniref:Tc1-like transposase DDE domain-containing protein n=1 Tax=Puccinia sorghi TaxID=27349 RepID=A0A0L6ULH5_9BASI|nr:hypothetical protein VP01_5063g1 [Puccinia sorghi]